jgi:gluconolactonase
MRFPNHPVFDIEGNLYVSDSGDYWSENGDGCIFVIRPDGRTELFHAGPLRYPNGLAIDPSGKWLYVAQSPAWNIVRIPLDRVNGDVHVAFRLPDHTIPDGITFAASGELLVGCYRPDSVWLCHPDGRSEPLAEDPTAELLQAPTNMCLHDGNLFVANLAGRHIAVLETALVPAVVHRPRLST